MLNDDLREQINKIELDQQSGACELALKALTIYQSILDNVKSYNELGDNFKLISIALIKAQPGMSPIFNLANEVLLSFSRTKNIEEAKKTCQESLDMFEKKLCENGQKIAENAIDLIPPGELIFVYSFSSTIVTTLLNAKARGRYFRVVSTEARPSYEGRKISQVLAQSSIEVTHTFDSALGLVLPNCKVAFMGADCVGLPGVVNKVGSWLLAIACQKLDIPLYVLCDTDKFVDEDRLFEFEKHIRPNYELWSDAPIQDKYLKLLNPQYELVSLDLITGFVTETGLIKNTEVLQKCGNKKVHDAIKLEEAFS